MFRDDDPRTLFFLHIPRTGGTTMSKYLSAFFHDSEICPYYSLAEAAQEDPKQLKQYRLFLGHYHYNFIEMLPANPRIMTFLRHPIDRVVSWYRFLRFDPYHDKIHLFRGKSFREVIEETPELEPEIRNPQVSLLSADQNIQGAFETAGNSVPELVSPFPCRNRTPDLALAKERLRNMDAFGLTERYQESVELIVNTLRWPEQHTPLPVLNQANEREVDVDADTLALIESMNCLDMELYEYGRKLFPERMLNFP